MIIWLTKIRKSTTVDIKHIKSTIHSKMNQWRHIIWWNFIQIWTKFCMSNTITLWGFTQYTNINQGYIYIYPKKNVLPQTKGEIWDRLQDNSGFPHRLAYECVVWWQIFNHQLLFSHQSTNYQVELWNKTLLNLSIGFFCVTKHSKLTRSS